MSAGDGVWFGDWVQQTVTVGGTGTLTLGSAVSGYQTIPDALHLKLVSYSIKDGTAWETGFGTYNKVTPSLARDFFRSSSTGSLLNVSTSAVVSIDLNTWLAQGWADYSKGAITGLLITKNDNSHIDVSAGYCYDPSSEKIISYAGGTAISAGTLGASQWNQVYIYDNAGTSTLEIVNNADPPSTTYTGTARMGGTNGNRRWIGSFQTDGSSNVLAHVSTQDGFGSVEVHRASQAAVLSAGTSTSYASVSFATAMPRYAALYANCDAVLTYVTTAAASLQVQISPDGGTTDCFRARIYVYITSDSEHVTGWIPVDPATPQIHYKVVVVGAGAGPQCSLNVLSYRFTR